MVNLATNPTTSFREVTGWRDAINESVHTSDDQDIGDVEAVLRKVEQFIALKKLQDHFSITRYYQPSHAPSAK